MIKFQFRLFVLIRYVNSSNCLNVSTVLGFLIEEMVIIVSL